MYAIDLLILFLITSAVFACVPVPGMLYAIGFHLAGFGHVVAAAFGVTILLQAILALYIILKAIGASYLIWLGISYLTGQAPLAGPVGPASSAEAASGLKDSIVVEALNPKSALFFLAILPQLTNLSADLPVWPQIVVLEIIINAMFSISDLGRISAELDRTKSQISYLAISRTVQSSGPI